MAKTGLCHSQLASAGMATKHPLAHPKDPAVLKTLRYSELLCRSVFTMPPNLLHCEPFFERRDACKTKKMMSAQGGHDSKSLYDSEFTMHSRFTSERYFEYGGVLWAVLGGPIHRSAA